MIHKSILFVGWALMGAVTVYALEKLGLAAAPPTFLHDLAHPWRAQFYTDLELHLFVFAAWIMWRERSLTVALPAAAATLLLGALFTFPYLILASIRAGGDVRRLLLGTRAA
jgi:hypothetical protein